MDRKSPSRVAFLSLCLLLPGGAPARAAALLGLGHLPDDTFSQARDVAVAGSQVTAVGISGYRLGPFPPPVAPFHEHAFRWTPDRGIVALEGATTGDPETGALVVSGDASIVAGIADGVLLWFPGQPLLGVLGRWTSEGELELLRLPNGQVFFGSANAVSADGSVVVGGGEIDRYSTQAFRWTSEGGAVGLGFLPGGYLDYSTAEGVSGDGSVVVGWSFSAPGDQAFRWTAEGGMVGLGDLPGGGFGSRAHDISADGSVIVGESRSESARSGEAFRYTERDGMIGLGTLPGVTWSRAYAVSGDGSAVVGSSNGAFLWDETHAMRRLQDLLADDYGLDLTGWVLDRAQGISDDGTAIVGTGTNPAGETEAWLAVLSEPTLTSVAGGSFNDPATWDAGSVIPSQIHATVVAGHTVTVATDAAALSLSIIDPGGRLVVAEGTLTIVNHVEVAAGGLQLALNGTIDVGRELVMSAGAVYASELDGLNTGRLAAGGNASLAGTLELSALGKLREVPFGELQWYGDETRSIITADNVVGLFSEEPPTVPDEPAPENHGRGHLGHGVFLTDDGPNGQGVIYQPGAVRVDLFQAADGDTNGNRVLDGYDLQAILAAQTFGTGRPADWTTGDFTAGVNGTSAGVTDGEDLQAILATGLWGTPQPYAAVDPGDPGDGVVDLILDPASGGLSVETDGVTINGYVIKSAGGIFTGEPAQNLGAFQIDNHQEISGNFFFTLDGEHFFGNVIGPEWEIFTKAKGGGVNPFEDLTFTYTRVDMPGTFFGNLIVIPEPATVVMLLTGAVALLLLVIRR